MRKQNYTLLLSMLFPLLLSATTYTSIGDGDWNDPNNWSPNGVPKVQNWPGDQVIIQHDITFSGNLRFRHGSGLQILAGGSLTVSSSISIDGGANGNYLVEAGGELNCPIIRLQSGSATITFAGDVSGDQLEVTSGAELITYGFLTFEEINVSGGSNFFSTGGQITLDEDFTVSGGATVTIRDTDLIIGGSFENASTVSMENVNLDIAEDLVLSGGASLTITGSSQADIGGDLDLSGGTQLNIDGFSFITVSQELSVTGGAGVTIDGGSNLSADVITLSGSGNIQGVSDAGMLYYNQISLSGGAQVVAADGTSFGAGEPPLPSPIDLRGASPSLPVELTAFNARRSDRGNMLTWSTASELNNDHFEVQHSTDGVNYAVIAYIEGNGTTYEPQNYSYLHADPAQARTHYYRLRQVDFDGAFEFSPVVVVAAENDFQADQLPVFPNPARDQIQVELPDYSENLTLQLIAVTGQRISLSFQTSGKKIQAQLPFGLTPGMYYLEVNTEGASRVQSLMVR